LKRKIRAVKGISIIHFQIIRERIHEQDQLSKDKAAIGSKFPVNGKELAAKRDKLK
jgi:hypothetical protein